MHGFTPIVVSNVTVTVTVAPAPIIATMQLLHSSSSTQGLGAMYRVNNARLQQRVNSVSKAVTCRVRARAANVPEIYQEGIDPEVTAFQEHQKTAARPSPAEYGRTLMTLARSCVLSTVSSHPSSSGFPFGSVVEFAVDSEGRPLLATSTLSPHTADLQADGRCSITVTAPGFKVVQDGGYQGWQIRRRLWQSSISHRRRLQGSSA
eukprot:GHRR01019143.1.p1 GENE.GHRR01019143.1~~GHRR01019143.1.p1  ORF type:complete len:206 (+),score=56.02 GHRR01019143.1:466-1083(+)